MRKVWIILDAILFVLHYGRSVQGDGCHLFRSKDCCKLCEPGYFLQGTCGPCKPCPHRGYNDKPNDHSSCHLCRRCEGIFQYKSKCSATQNAVCRCITGKKCADEECSQCENNPCPAGQQLIGAECVNCLSGTFNPGTEGTCQPWKNCLAIDAVILVNGTSTADVVCGNHLAKPTRVSTTSATSSVRKVTPGPGADIIIPATIGVAFFIAVFFVTIVCLLLKLEKIKNKFKPVQQIEEGGTDEYHFPEEEEGGECKDTDHHPSSETLPVV